jgi:hypothetical protein
LMRGSCETERLNKNRHFLNLLFPHVAGNLQRSEEVQRERVRSRFDRPRQHGNHRRFVHFEGHQR